MKPQISPDRVVRKQSLRGRIGRLMVMHATARATARAAARIALAASIAAGTLVTGAPPAHAGEATSFVFSGRGWGHGVGLSQYGARAQAIAGRTASQIIRSYYDGVSFATRVPENIRVLLESDNDVVVTALEPFTARVGSTTIATSSSEQPFLRALPSSDVTEDGARDVTRLYRGGSRTGPWTLVTTRTSQTIRFVPGASRLRLVYDGGAQRTFRRYIEAYRTSSTRVHAVNQLWLEEYLYGVVPWEMPSSWHPEALKAQAIVARSYAVNQKIRRRAAGNWYDICATTSCQVYGGYSAEHSSSNAAVNATEGRVATHPDSGTTANGVILAVFSSSSGGATENNTDGFGSSTQYPYLRSVSDPWSLDSAANNPYSSWETSVSSSTVASKVGLDSVSTIRVVERNVSRSADTLAFTGVKNGARTTVNRSGLWTRSTFGLRSIFIRSIHSPPFSDDDGSPHEPDIVAIWRAGVTAGCGSGRFCPAGSVTRGQMAQFLANALTLPPAEKDHFTDDNDSPFHDSINRVAAAGITAGCGEDRYCPGGLVNRAQMATFLMKAFAVPASDQDFFTDDESAHEGSINAIAAAGITAGCGGGKYCPAGIVDRASMATFLAHGLELA